MLASRRGSCWDKGKDLSRVAGSHHLNVQRSDLCQVLALGLDHAEASPVQRELGPGEELQQCAGDGHQHQQVEAALAESRSLRWGWGWWFWPGLNTPHNHWGLLKKVMTYGENAQKDHGQPSCPSKVHRHLRQYQYR